MHAAARQPGSVLEAGTGVDQPRRVLLLVNAKSRRGRVIGAEARQALQALGCAVIPEADGSRQRAAAMVQRHAATVDVVAVVGGDGSMTGAAASLLETGLP